MFDFMLCPSVHLQYVQIFPSVIRFCLLQYLPVVVTRLADGVVRYAALSFIVLLI